MIPFLRKHHRKIQEIGTGLFFYEGFNYLYDFAFYPFALVYWGFLVGGIIVVSLSFVMNAFVFWLYEYMRVDWLGAHALRELENEEQKGYFTKMATWLGKEKKYLWERLLSPVVFVALLLPVDPTIVAIHYQRQHFRGLGWRDWGLLLVATAVANAWWLLKIELVIQALLYLWQFIF